jgi:hypothetical protein
MVKLSDLHREYDNHEELDDIIEEAIQNEFR